MKEVEKLTAAVETLGHMNARRFNVLLAAIGLGKSFTSADLRGALMGNDAALNRDLVALETAGFLVGQPPLSTARQGQRVTYTVDSEGCKAFARLAQLIEQAFLESNL